MARVLLIAHAATEATRAAAFPGPDEPLLEVPGTLVLPRGFTRAAVRTGPELRARETAQGLGATTDDALHDLDAGRWTGRTLDDVTAEEPEALGIWLTDLSSSPHGGESVDELVQRVGGWLATIEGPTVAVTHPAVVRGAVLHVLGAPAQSFWRIDVGPLAQADLRGGPGRWSLRLSPA